MNSNNKRTLTFTLSCARTHTHSRSFSQSICSRLFYLLILSLFSAKCRMFYLSLYSFCALIHWYFFLFCLISFLLFRIQPTDAKWISIVKSKFAVNYVRLNLEIRQTRSRILIQFLEPVGVTTYTHSIFFSFNFSNLFKQIDVTIVSFANQNDYYECNCRNDRRSQLTCIFKSMLLLHEADENFNLKGKFDE